MNHITNPQLLERVDAFLRGITAEDKVVIVHDTDPDGICSAVIMAKCIERLRKRKIDLHISLDRKTHGISAAMISSFKKKKITKIITTDFSLEQDPETIKKLEKFASILVVDHHKVYNEIQSDKTLLYKPQFFTSIDPPKYCTGKLAYDAANRVVNASDLDWMTAAACIADIATQPWEDWLSQVLSKHNIHITNFDNSELFKNRIGQVAATISSTEIYNQKLVPKCFDAFYVAKGPDDVLNSVFGKYKKIIDKELYKHLDLFETKAEIYGETHFYELKSKYRVNSPLSTILGLKYPNRTILIVNTTKPTISVSARRNDKNPPVNTLLENAIKGFKDANGGGHAPAAGAGFSKKYLKTFKQRIIEASHG
ncbi:DHH family phosphoesterase [Candidatus Woesearchaeota archaeon]|nr:DHH family phosphoesterase [Candidatus Woesearchaeota archaeon]